MNIRRQKHSRKEISLIPLINIIFLLLIFFMIAGNIQRMEVLNITPPKSSDGKEKRYLPIILSLDSKGNIALNSNPVKEGDLNLLIETSLAEYPDQPVTIRADKSAAASRLIWLMNRLQNAGASDISIITVQ